MASSSRAQPVVRRLVERLALALVALGGLQTFLVDGLIPALRVDSGSMAPRLLGPHVAVECAMCGFKFEAEPPDEFALGRWQCPMCQTPIDVEAMKISSGDRLLVDRTVFAWRDPRRGELVVFDCPESAQPCVKRILGLPNESIEIKDGDVWIDGRISGKSIADWHDARILVHEDRRVVPSSSHGLTWKPEPAEATAWARKAKGWVHGAERKPRSTDWLKFSGNTTSKASPVLWDDLPYNSNESRKLDQISDVSLECQMKLGGEGAAFLRGSWRGRSVEVEYSLATRTVLLSIEGKIVDAVQVGGQLHPSRWELVLVDGRAVVATDGTAICQGQIGQEAVGKPSPVDLAVGATSGVHCDIEHLTVYRDIYYTNAARMSVPRRISEDEYFLLGDNSSASRDSRHWPAGAIRRSHLRGKPVIMKAAN